MPVAAQQAGIVTIPAPVGGVDFYSSIFGMPPENALRLTNWWPEVYGCTHRRGYTVWADQMPGPVHSLYTYNTRSGQNFLYAFSGDGAGSNAMYDVTNRDTVSPPPARVPKVSALTTAVWQGTMFSNSAGTHKILVSGQDEPIWIHQTAPPDVVFSRIPSGDGTGGTIGGANPVNFIDVTIHQKRVWFVEKGTCNGWYLPAEQVTGVVTKFDFGPLFKRGGFLQSLATWTIDSGDGPDDLLVAFGSEGDIAVYKGINPNDPETWALQGVYYAGALLQGHRFHCKVGGDLKFLTHQGLISMNTIFTSSQAVGPQNTVEAQPIQQFLVEQTSLYHFLHGWDMKYVPTINMLIINIPSVTQTGALQLVENIVNSKWSTFLGYDAGCFCPDFQDVPFFCAGTQIMQGWTGNTDNVTLDDPKGKPITALAQQAYNYLGTPANNKQVGIYRPNFLTDRQVAWKSHIFYDFHIGVPVLQVNPPQPTQPLWDIAIWDSAIWSGGLHAQKQWAHAAGLGMAASLAIATRSDGEVIWVNTDMTVQSGGIL